MQGVTTAIIGFILLSLAFPSLIRRSAQFYLAVGAVLIIIFMDGLAMWFSSKEPTPIIYLAVAVLQIFAVILLILATGGISARELAGNLARGYEVLRRGEDETETIIPTGPRPVAPAAGGVRKDEERVVYTIAAGDPAGVEKKKDEDTSLPLT